MRRDICPCERIARRDILSLKLIRQYQVCVAQQALVRGHHVVGDVQAAVVAHDGVQDPEEASPVLRVLRLMAQLLGDGAHGLDGGGARHVPREHHVEAVEEGHLEALPQVRDLLRRDPRAFPLAVSRVVACSITFLY